MIAFLDVHYQADAAFAAAILCAAWNADHAVLEKVVCAEQVAPYEPGSFYKRELPCLLAALHAVPRPAYVVIDGNVWLDGDQPGLGAHLYEALKQEVPVIGIAKTSYRGSTNAQAVFRGTSQRPLYVTAAGIDPVVAADLVKHMPGAHRMPSLVKRVDQLCRQHSGDGR